MLTGENGILSKTQEAKEKTGESNDLEYLQMEAYNAVTSYYINGKTGSESEYILEELGKLDRVETNILQGTIKYNGKIYDVSEITGNTNEQKAIKKNGLQQITLANATTEEDKKMLAETDENGDAKLRMIIVEKINNNGMVKAVIPSGFYYVTGKITEGLVISDKFGDDNNNSKGGNQFVWVPCNGGEAIYQKHIYTATTIDDTSTKSDDGNGNWITSNYRKYSDWTDLDDRMVKEASIAKYGGFYIARYEAGETSDADFYNDKDGSTYWQSYYDENISIKYGDNDYKTDTSKTYVNTYKSKNKEKKEDEELLLPVSKKNIPSWNFIDQTTSKKVAENMYKNSKAVTSYLVDGIAWDTVTQWIFDKGKNVIDSTLWGNYWNTRYNLKGLYARHQWKKGTDNNSRWYPAYVYNYGTYNKENEYLEIATGSSDRNVAQNIFDLAGNMWEWSTETGSHDNKATNNSIYAVLRGGGLGNNGDEQPICSRNSNISNNFTSIDIGFRVVLYIK